MGTPPSVNANTMLIVTGTAITGSTFPVALDTPVLFKSVDDLETHGITMENNPNAYRHITDFYNPTMEVNNTGTYLWVVLIGPSDTANVTTKLPDFLRATVVNGFQYRPRQIVVALAMQKALCPPCRRPSCRCTTRVSPPVQSLRAIISWGAPPSKRVPPLWTIFRRRKQVWLASSSLPTCKKACMRW